MLKPIITTEVVVITISYRPLWETLKKKRISTYILIKDYSFSKGTLNSLKQNKSVNLYTLLNLCNMLDCGLTDVVEFVPDENNNP